MDINSFIRKFADQFDNTNESFFSAQTRFRDLDEWSSLIALSVIAMVDEEYDVRLKGNDMRNANTVQDLYDVVHRLTQIDAE
jgi:acyl carrier protein